MLQASIVQYYVASPMLINGHKCARSREIARDRARSRETDRNPHRLEVRLFGSAAVRMRRVRTEDAPCWAVPPTSYAASVFEKAG